MNRTREREFKIGKEKWFVSIHPHFLERLKSRCGNEVAIDDAIRGFGTGYVVIPKKQELSQITIHVLCKIPFAKCQNMPDPIWLIVARLEPYKKLHFVTVYMPFMD